MEKIVLTESEIVILKQAFEVLERERFVNERDNPHQYSMFSSYIGENGVGYAELENGQKVKLELDTTPDNNLHRIKISPHKGAE